MCIRKNKSKQKITGGNYGNIAGRDINEIYNDNRKYITIIEKVYNLPAENNKKYHSEEYKNYINSFKELEDYLFSFIFPKLSKKYKFSGDYLSFAKEILDWIMGISEFPLKKYKLFCQELTRIYKVDKEDIIIKRWEALGYYFSSNITESVNIYNNILENIESLEYPNELIDDILIDGRNILIEQGQLDNRIILDNPFQKEIQKHGRKLAMPIYDRIKVDCYEKTIKDTFNTETKGQDTLMFGSSLNSILNEIQNLIYNTIFYGSITHLKLCREVISNVMYSYSKIYGNEEFYKITLKMLALSGEYKEYKKLCLYLGDSFNFWYSKDFINEITSLKNKTLDYKKINYNNFIYGFYGKYLNDKDYNELEQSVLEYLRNIEKANVNLVSEIFKNIKVNLHRTNRINEVINIFEIIISKKFARYFYDISNILNNINVDNIDLKVYKKYVEIVYKLSNASSDVNLNLSIAKILNKGKYTKKFDKYKKDLKIKELMTFDKDISDDYKFLEKMISDYEKRYNEKEKNPQVVVGYDVSYILSREYFENAFKNNEIIALIEGRYLPLILKIFESEKQTNSFKLEQLKNLLYISSVDNYIFMRDKIVNIINKIRYGFGKENQFINCFNYVETNNYEIDLYVDFINSLLNDDTNLNNTITICFENYFNNKISLPLIIDCLKVVGFTKKRDEVILNQIYCFYISVSEKEYISKLETIDLLIVFANTKYEIKILKILEKFSVNCTFDMSKKIINIIREYDINKTNKILDNLKGNENINVRLMVKNYEDRYEK